MEVSLRTSQKHLANNSAVLTKAQLLDKVSKHLPVTNGALETDRAFGVTAMWPNGALSCTRLEVSLRTSQKHVAITALCLQKRNC